MQNKNEIITIGILFPETSEKMHQTNSVYGINGVAATIKSCCYKDPPKIMVMKNEKVSDI